VPACRAPAILQPAPTEADTVVIGTLVVGEKGAHVSLSSLHPIAATYAVRCCALSTRQAAHSVMTMAYSVWRSAGAACRRTRFAK
jgi:hypothetical protein